MLIQNVLLMDYTTLKNNQWRTQTEEDIFDIITQMRQNVMSTQNPMLNMDFIKLQKDYVRLMSTPTTL